MPTMRKVMSVPPTAILRSLGSDLRLPEADIATNGLTYVETILANAVVSSASVSLLSDIYATFDRLERLSPSTVAARSTAKIVEQVIKYIEKIINTPLHKQDVSALISLFYLQKFKAIPLASLVYEKFIAQVKFALLANSALAKTWLQQLPNLLPLQEDEALFKEDARTLLKTIKIFKDLAEVDAYIAEHFSGSIKAIQQSNALKQDISTRRVQLHISRREQPGLYPDYFDRILDQGYLHLYDHLLDILSLPVLTHRTEMIKSLDYFKAASIVLETRQAVSDAVTQPSQPVKTVVFLLGGSGSGKSTSLCFLSEEDMAFRTGQYVSKGGGNQYIGHSQASSCTFFPNSVYLPEQSVLLVDFPGFNDSNGELVSLGMELALKSLIKQYQPKVLLLESITNTEGRFANIKKLSQHIQRILENPSDCTLGITKYRNDPDYGALTTIETQQREQLLQTSEKPIHDLETEINVLNGVIPTLPEAFRGPLLDQVRAKQAALATLKAAASQPLEQPLSDTPEKKTLKTRLQERETLLKEQSGTSHVLTFAELEDKSRVRDYLKALVDSPSVRLNPQLALNIDVLSILDFIFTHSVLTRLINEFYGVGDKSTFESDVLKRSLIARLTQEKEPEMGEFLHLLEMDKGVAKKYDQKIIKAYVDENIKILVKSLCLGFSDKLLDKVSSATTKRYKQLEKEMQIFLCGLRGVSEAELKNPELMEKKWVEIQNLYKNSDVEIGKSYALDGVIFWLAVLPFGIPYGINRWAEYVARQRAQKGIAEANAEIFMHHLEVTKETIKVLKRVETLIMEHDNIERAFNNIDTTVYDLNYGIYKEQVRAVSTIVNGYSPNMFETWVDEVGDKIAEEFKQLKKMPSVQRLFRPAKQEAGGSSMLDLVHTVAAGIGAGAAIAGSIHYAIQGTIAGQALSLSPTNTTLLERTVSEIPDSAERLRHFQTDHPLTDAEFEFVKMMWDGFLSSSRSDNLLGLFMFLFCIDNSLKSYDADKLLPYICSFMPVDPDSALAKGIARALVVKYAETLPVFTGASPWTPEG
jgi:hypothetical protein